MGALGENSRLALDGGALRLASVENLTSVSGSGALLLHTQGTVQAGEMMQKSAGLEGGLTMESGTLAVSGEVQTLAQGIHMGGAGLGMADGSTLSGALELDAATTATVQGAASISAAISGDSLAVESTGTLTLMSGNSMSSLAVNGGTVVAGSASALGKGMVSVAAGATLALDAAVSELTTLTLADGATLALNGSLAGKTVLEADNIALSGNLTLKFNGALTTGDTFTLAGAVASSAIWNIVTEERSSISTFVSGDSIVFTVNSAGAATLVWNGENGAVWNHENTAWLNADKADSFITNDHVSFGDADTRNVTVTSEGVQVGSLLITADGYNFSGGDISAAQITVMNKVSPEGTPEGTTAHINSVLRSSGDVHYSGSGMLVLSGGQDIAGSLNINSGYVQVLHSEGLAGGVQLEENGTLVLNEAGKEWQGGSIRGTGVVDLMGTYRASDLHDAFVLAAEGPSFQGTIAMEGGSRFIMDADSTAPFADVTFLVEQGSGFLMDTQHALTSDIELTLNGFLGFNRDGVLTGTVTVDGGGTLQVAEGIKATLNGRLVGREDGGELTLLGGGLLEIGGLKGSASLLVQDGDLSVSSAASLGKLTLAGNNTLSLVKGQLLTVDSLELNGDNALAFSGELEENQTYTLLSSDKGLNFADDWLQRLSLALDERREYELSHDGQNLMVTVGAKVVGNYIWVAGEEDNVWNRSVFHKQWDSDNDGLGDTSFFLRDSVTFAEAGTRSVVVGQDGVGAADVLVSGSGYSFSGGAISAASLHDTAESGTNRIANDITVSGSLTKSGAGTLELSGQNSFGSIVLEGGRLVAGSDHALGHDAVVAVSNGAELFVANGANVHNALSGESFTIGAEAGQQGTFSGAAAASLVASGLTKVGEGRVVLVNDSSAKAATMHIHAGTLAYDAGSSTRLDSVSGDGLFELIGGTLTVNSIQFDIERVHLNGGSLVSDSTLTNRRFELSNGSSLQLNHGCNLGNSDVLLHEGTALRVGNSWVSGSVEVDGNASLVLGIWGDTANVTSAISGVGTLSLAHWHGNVSTVSGVIADGEGGALAVRSDHNNVILSGANTYTGGTIITAGILTANNASALGTGAVMVEGGTLRLNRDVQIGTLSGTDGTIDFSGKKLTVNQHQDSSYTGIFEGKGSLVKTGAGMLTLDRSHDETNEEGVTTTVYDLMELGSLEVLQGVFDAHNLAVSDTLHFDMQAGATMSLDSLTLRDGATLSYIGSGNYADVRSLQVDGGLRLELSQLVGYLTEQTDGVYNTFNLGLNLGKDLTHVSVNGQEAGMYVFGFDEATLTTTIRLNDSSSWIANFSPVNWDANWGVAGLAGAPEKMWSTTLDRTTDFVGSTYDNGSSIGAILLGTTGTVDVYALKNTDNINSTGTLLERDVWLRLEGGRYGIVAGARVNNWNNDAHPWSFKGDWHYLLTDCTVNELVGLSSEDGARPHFEGNTYITVGQGVTVNDSIIGAGATLHSDGMELTGNTNVFVYSVQSTNDANAEGSIFSNKRHAIVGGFAYISNYATSFTLTGNTNVTIDVADYSGDYADFVKNVYGGNISYGCTGTISGNTHVSISGHEKVTFTGAIAAGSLSSGTENIGGNTTLTINGGVFGGNAGSYLTGGSVVSGGNSTITGTASVILNGGTISRNVYAAGIANGGSSTVGATLVEIGKDVRLGSITLSGGFSNPARGSVMGERTLLLHDGATVTSGVTVKDFSHIRVDEGSAASLSSAAALGSFAKTGAGELKLNGAATTSAVTAIDLQAGKLTFQSDAAIGSLNGSAGTELDFGNHSLTVSQTAEGRFEGSFTGGSFTKLGDAALEVTNLTLSGTLNANEHALTIGSLTLFEGASINYSSMNTAITVGSFTARGSYTIGLKGVVDELLGNDGSYATLDLGMNLSQSLTGLSVEGMTADMYTIGYNASTGNSTLTLTSAAADALGFKAISWDTNWAATGAPERVWQTELTATTAFAGSSYDNGKRVAVTVFGTSDVVDLFATANLSATGAAAVAMERDAWVEVTGGTFGVIAGAHLNNWNNIASSFRGDWHFQIKGGTVNDVIGLSYKDAKKPGFEGNTYISVYEGATINDSIIGGAELQHNAGAELTGSTHIYIYDVLDTNPDSLSGSRTAQRYNAVIGGHAYGTNQGGGRPMYIDGSTNILVDVSAYDGEAANFVKSIFGGNVRTAGSLVGTITQGTQLAIKANELVTFTEHIVGGSRVNGDTETIGQGTTLSIDGGIYVGGTGKFITAGSWLTGGTSVIDGTATLILSGDTQIQRHVYVAGYSGGGYSTVGATRLEIGRDVTFRGTGIKISGGFTHSSKGTVGDRTLALHDGVDLNANSEATLENFSHVEVALGLATVRAAQTNSLKAFSKSGAGTLAFTGTGSSSSAITLEEGTLQYAGQAQSGALTFAGEAAMGVTGTLSLTGNTIRYTGTGAAVVDATVTNSTGRLTFDIASAGKGEGFAELALTGAIGTSGANFGMDKIGDGTLLLGGANLYAWGTNVQAGRLIAASDSALGTGFVDVRDGASLEIAAGTHTQVRHYLKLHDGAELVLHDLSTEKANLGTDGLLLNGSEPRSSLGAFTLTLAEDTELAAGTGYKLISLENNSSIGMGENINVNYLGTGRYDFVTRVDGNTLLLDVSQQANTELVWDGTEEDATWNQAAPNTNWNKMDASASESSFMNGDTVRFTEDATHKAVTVDAAGVQAQRMEVSGQGYSFHGGNVRSASAALEQGVELADGASFSLGEVYTISQNSEAKASLGKLDLGSDAENREGHIHGMGGVTVLDHALIDIAKGVTVSLKDVLLTQHSRITDDPSTVNMVNTTIEIGTANTSGGTSSTLAADTMLYRAGELTLTTTLTESASVYNVYCSSLDTVNVTGSSLTLDMSSFAANMGDELNDYDYVAVSFRALEDGQIAHFNAESLRVTATFDNGQTYNDVWVMNTSSEQASAAATLYVSVAGGMAVPEPTTATLSLLALAALAARRRRTR